jgi:hypothetical protein
MAPSHARIFAQPKAQRVLSQDWRSSPIQVLLLSSTSTAICLQCCKDEWLAADEPFVWYALPLALDSWYTYRMTVPWVALIVQAQIDTPATATATAIIISAVSSVAVALFGERLLFGRRR